jgi:hypothetical protein
VLLTQLRLVLAVQAELTLHLMVKVVLIVLLLAQV